MAIRPRSFLVVFVLPVFLAAQSTAPPQTFRASSQLVLVPAYVTRNHQPVTGLTSADFVLLRDGKPEQIALFEAIEEAAAAAEPISVTTPMDKPSRIVVRHAPTILLLDFLNLTPLGWERVHKKLPDIARAFGTDPVIVLALSWDGLVEVMPLGVPAAEFVAAAERWQVASNKKVANGWNRPSKISDSVQIAWMLSTFGVTADHAPVDVIDANTQKFDSYRMTLAAVEQIAHSYGLGRGRKRLIWVSSDIPEYIKHTNDKKSGKERANADQMRALQSLSDANIAIYPVVFNQLAAFGGSLDVCGTFITSPSFNFVYETGGSVCDDAPDLCVKRAIADAKNYYLLGFYLHSPTEPGWHTLKVSTLARGLDIRAKQSFIVGFDAE